jgi:hypothetical protein
MHRERLALTLALMVGCTPETTETDGGPRADAPAADAPPGSDAPAPTGDCPTLDTSNPSHVVLGRASSGPALIDADTTWTSDNVYFVIGSLDIMASTLTIEAGTRVCLDAGTGVPPSLDFRPASGGVSSGLVVEGTASAPVVFAPATPESSWNQINFSTDASASLAHLVLIGGGSGGSGVLRIPADFPEPLDATVRIVGASGMGVALEGDLGLAAGSSITIESLLPGSFAAPAVSASLAAASTLRPDNLVIGADVPAAMRWLRLTDGVVDASVTLRGDLGLAYVVIGDLEVARATSADPIPTLTLQAGVELRFEGGRLRVGSSSGLESDGGNLVAAGTATNPVRFVSASDTPAAGDWVGIEIFPESFEPSVTALRHVVIADAGQDLGGGVLYCGMAATPIQGAIRLPYGGGLTTYEGPALEGVVSERSAGDGVAFTCLPTRCLGTDYTGAITGNDIAGELLRARGCP